MLGRRKVYHALGARSGRDDAHTARALQHHIAQFATPLDDIGQRALGRKAQQHIDIGQAQVGVEQHDPAAQLGQRQRQIH